MWPRCQNRKHARNALRQLSGRRSCVTLLFLQKRSETEFRPQSVGRREYVSLQEIVSVERILVPKSHLQKYLSPSLNFGRPLHYFPH